MARANARQRLAQEFALFLGTLDEALFVEHGEHGERRRRRERIAAERRSVRAGGQRAREPFRAHHRADREAAAETLRERDGVGHDTLTLTREKRPGAPDARL